MRKTPKYIYVIIIILFVLIGILALFFKLSNQSILVFPETNQEITKEEKLNKQQTQKDKEIKDKEKAEKNIIDKWAALSLEDKKYFKSLDNYRVYLKNPNNYTTPNIFKDEKKQNDLSVNKGYEKDKAKGTIQSDMNLALLPVDSQYKVGGIYYNNNEEIPIIEGEYNDTFVTYKQQNDKHYTINMFSYGDTADTVKSNYTANFEPIHENIERAITNDSYIYIVTTPNGAFSVTATAQNDIGYYDDLVINRMKRSY